VVLGSSSMCWVAIPLLLGALGCVELRSVKGLFMSLVFACCTICDRSGVITISTPFLIRS
jgi:hypothetical protein